MMQAEANLFRTLVVLPVVLLVAVVVALFGLGIRAAETQTTSPKMQDLGTLGGSSSEAKGINDSGQVVGYSDTSDGSSHAFLYDGTMHDLDTLGGSSSEAKGINDSGKVVGYSETESGEWHAFLYDSKSDTPKMQDLNDLVPADLGWTIMGAAAINSDGKIAAYADKYPPYGYLNGWWSAFVLTPATPSTYEVQDLGTLLEADPLYAASSYATGINDFGQVVGTALYSCSASSLTCYDQRAFLYEEGATPEMQDLGYLRAAGINYSGQVVGSYYQYVSSTYSYTRALLYDDGTMQNLGSLGGNHSEAKGINDSGKVVGYSDTSDGVGHAFLKESDQPMRDLNTLLPADLGWTIDTATAINTDGKIAANGYKDGVGNHALLLTPTSDSEAPSPPTITSPSDNSNDSDGNITFSGTAERGSTVKVYQDGATTTAAGQATASTTDGSWTINLTGISEQPTAHTFDFTATDAAGNESTEKTTRQVVVGPYAPSGLTASQNGTTNNQYIKLAWKDNSDIEKNFTVERCTGSSSYCASQGSWSVRTSTLPANTQSYTDTGLSRRTTYTYRVKATNDSASSDYSNTASVTTK